MHAPRMSEKARKNSAPVKLPVAPLSRPTIHGPANPPRFPNELTSARPAAAPVPARIAVGKDQNVPIAAGV